MPLAFAVLAFAVFGCAAPLGFVLALLFAPAFADATAFAVFGCAAPLGFVLALLFAPAFADATAFALESAFGFAAAPDFAFDAAALRPAPAPGFGAADFAFTAAAAVVLAFSPRLFAGEDFGFATAVAFTEAFFAAARATAFFAGVAFVGDGALSVLPRVVGVI